MFLLTLINSKKIRYDTLDRLLDFRLNHIINKAEHVVIHIDINTIFRQLYCPPIAEQILKINNSKERYLISVEILNIIGHYRHYFWRNYEVPTTIITYYNFEKCWPYMKIAPTFKEGIYHKRFDDPVYKESSAILNENIKLAKLIIDYLPNIYFVDTKYIDTGLAMYYILLNYDICKKSSNLVLTTYNPYYQLLNINTKEINRNMTVDILFPAGKDSTRIRKRELINHILERNSKSKNESFVKPIYFPAINAIAGNDNFDLKGVPKVGIVKAIKGIEKLIAGKQINQNDYNIDELISLLKYDEYRDIINNNYKIFVLEYFYELLSDPDMYMLQNSFVDKDDIESVNMINEKYYKHNPIELDFLYDGYYG